MYPFSEHRPDCRIFFKRLVTPDPEVVKKVPLGKSHMDAITGFGMPNGVGAFHNYYPESFRKDLINRYREIYQPATTKLQQAVNEETKSIQELKKTIIDIQSQLKSWDHITSPSALLQALTKAVDQQASQSTLLENNQKSLSTVRPIYEPYLLELVIGLASVNTSILRTGVGTASITIKLPLEENGFVENILHGIKNTEMFNTAESGISQYDAKKMATAYVEKLSSRELSIYKLVRDSNGNVLYTDRRECAFLPNDMVQIYFTKRYTINKSTVNIPRFPQDYIPGFTGFVKNTNVNFTGGQNPSYTITINCEDIANPLRISRANIDPSVDPRFRAEGLSIAPWITKLQAFGDEEATGPKIIKSLIVGRENSWWGVSQIELVDDVGYDGSTGQYTFSKTGVKVVSMPWEFDRIPLNTYDDLINNVWQPYVSAFKTSYRLWESEYKYRWDICKEIADVMEFELYADNFGALNYHPPFYNLNPANMRYFIEDKDILSEQHSFTDSGIVTAVEVASQAQLGIPPNIVKILSAFATADDEWIQRYGMRFRQKNIPILSGTDRALQAGNQGLLHETRYLYARAWLNRRNLETQSATIEIPGTPEYFLCNSVAFVGNFGEFAAKLALKSVTSTIAGSTNLGNIQSATVEKALAGKELANKLVDNLKVYYISGISHKYAQGGNFTTTLTLTHGRLWGKHYNVGYAFSEDENDKLLQNFKKLLNRTTDDTEIFRKLMIQSGILNNIQPTVRKNATPSMDSITVIKPSDKNAASSIYSVITSQGTVVQ
jgi:hypothetical protein